MKHMIAVLLCAVLLSGFAGCGQTISEEEKPPASSEVSLTSSAPEASDTTETSSLQEPPLTEMDLETPLPDFLDEDQQNLYLRAKSIYCTLRSDTTNIDGVPFDEGCSAAFPAQTFETDHGRYYISTGRYQVWADFSAMMHSLFTDAYVEELTGANREFPTFFEKDGLLCYLDAARGSRLGYQKPDDYRLIEKMESSILFEVIGHYVLPGAEQSVETQSFPIRLVLTEHGWRFDQFAAPMLDS